MLDAGSRAVLDPASPTEFEVRVGRDPMRGTSPLVSSKPPSTIDTTALDGTLSAEDAQALLFSQVGEEGESGGPG